MTTEAATPEFYSACLQVILISWLIVAVETRVFTRTSMPTWIKIGLFAYGFTSVVAIYWCIRGLNKADVYIAPSWWPYGEITTDLIEGITTAMAFAAVFTMVATVLLPQFFNPGAQTHTDQVPRERPSCA